MRQPSRFANFSIIILVGLASTAVFFQNCARLHGHSYESSSAAAGTSGGATNNPPPAAPICTPNSSRSCTISGGAGSQVCNMAGSAWEACLATSCQSGYKLVSGVCASCLAPRHYQAVIPVGGESSLPCGATGIPILALSIPDTGRALARAQLVFRNNHNKDIYYWSAHVLVGTPLIAGDVGDDICPSSASSVKSILGYGTVGAGANVVNVIAHAGSSSCVDGQVSVFSGGFIDVWVEDPNSACVGKDVALISSTSTVSGTYTWTTAMTELLRLPVPVSANRSQMLVMGAVEGSPLQNPNPVCGQESASLVIQTISSASGILSTVQQTIPASGGMGHLVISSSTPVSYNGALPSSVSLWVGSNTGQTDVITGGCCGDGKIGFVKQP